MYSRTINSGRRFFVAIKLKWSVNKVFEDSIYCLTAIRYFISGWEQRELAVDRIL